MAINGNLTAILIRGPPKCGGFQSRALGVILETPRDFYFNIKISEELRDHSKVLFGAHLILFSPVFVRSIRLPNFWKILENRGKSWEIMAIIIMAMFCHFMVKLYLNNVFNILIGFRRSGLA